MESSRRAAGSDGLNKDAWRDLEEAVVEVSIATAVSHEAIADLDILSFSALADVVTRVTARHKYERAWTAMIAAQGTKDGMEKLTKPWQRGTETTKGVEDLFRDLKLTDKGGTV